MPAKIDRVEVLGDGAWIKVVYRGFGTGMYRKRQLMIVCVCVASLGIYFLLLLVPPTVRTVVALVGVPLVLLSMAYLAGHSMLRESRLRFVYRILPILLVCVCGYLLLPDFRRMILRRNLQTVGARVTLQFDESYTYVPDWLKNELDWAFLGQLKQVDFAHRHVPVHQIAKMSFTEPILVPQLGGKRNHSR